MAWHDTVRAQEYLSPTDFMEAFGMELATFQGKPNWQKERLKKKAQLF